MLGRLLTAPIRFIFWAFFPASTRDRSIRLSVLIVLMFGLAFAALAFKHINIDLPGGADLQREESGPLGLKLGLDLRGGGQLVYQADTGTRLDLTFEEPIICAPVEQRLQGSVDCPLAEQALQNLRFGEEELPLGEFSLDARGGLAAIILQISTGLLEENDPRVSGFQEAIQGALIAGRETDATITNSRIIDTGTGTQFQLAFQGPITLGEISRALEAMEVREDGLTLENPNVSESNGATEFTIDTTERLDPSDGRILELREAIETALAAVRASDANIASLRVINTDSSTQFHVTFQGVVTAAEVDRALGDLTFGAEGQTLENPTVAETIGFTEFLLETREVLDAGDPRRTGFQETVEGRLGAITPPEFDIIDAPTSDQMDGALDIINRRVNLYGTDEPVIQRFGDDRIIVQLPGASGSITTITFAEPITTVDGGPTLHSVLTDAGYEDVEIERPDSRTYRVESATVDATKREAAQAALAENFGHLAAFEVSSAIDDAKDLIGETAQLEFRERTCTDEACTQFTDADIGLTGDDLSDAYARAGQVGLGWEVVVHFNGRGTEIFSDLTERINQQPTKRIAVFLDDELILAPVAQAHIRDGVTRITGGFTREEARNFAIQLDAGRLPVPLKLIQENDVSALLGAESLRNSLIAGIIGLALVMGFMVTYYRMAGVAAAVALIFYAVVELSIFKLVPITLTLSHIGGFILSIGMAVDANVLIFERMKEEMRIGRTLASSMEVGFNRAWPAIRDGNVSTLITCGVLLWFGDRLGGGLVTGFAISLGIGVLLSMFTAVVLSRNLLQLMAWAGFRNKVGLFTPEGVPRAASTLGGRG